MLTEHQTKDILEHLKKAQNPIFYYDNDCDGICSYLLFRRYLGRGKGVAVRSFPDLNVQYARKAKELNADYAFVLDKPLVSEEFVSAINDLGLPLVWIDHHEIINLELEKKFSNVFIYNSTLNKEKSCEPVTYLAYGLTGRKEDLWLAVVGCIADHYFPDFVGEFGKLYPEFWGKVNEPFEAYYTTEIGKIAQAINFGLKDSTTNIVYLQNFLTSCKGPEEVFLELTANYAFRKRYKEIRRKYDSLLEKAKKTAFDKIVFFIYSGDLSMSSDIANELCYLYPEKYIAVAYKSAGVSNLSLRGKNVRAILENILKSFENASGGGHECAVGARIQTNDLAKFQELFNKEVELTWKK